jgi:hypothetical protein
MAAKKKVPTSTSPKSAGKAGKKASTGAKPPTQAELAAMFGVTVKTPLRAEEIWRLRKALPGYVAVLDDAAQLLEDEGEALQIAGVTPAELLAAQADQKYLAGREAVLYGVYRSVYEQRLQVDDRAMKMLEKIARRVNALAEDDPTLKTRWKILLDFLATFRSGGAPKGEADTTAPAAPPEEPAGEPSPA